MTSGLKRTFFLYEVTAAPFDSRIKHDLFINYSVLLQLDRNFRRARVSNHSH